MTFGGALRALKARDLAEVFRNRPHAAQLARVGGGVDVSALAGVLALPEGIHRAVASLSEFHQNLLIVGVWFGGDVRLAELRRQTPGVSDKELSAGISALARYALAFPQGTGTARSLWIPRCVTHVVENTGEPGVRVGPYFEELTVDELAGIARGLGLGWSKKPRKADMVTQLSDALGESAVVERALATVPPVARKLFEVVRSGGGYAPWGELIAAGLAGYGDQYGSSYGPYGSRDYPAAAALTDLGLAIAARHTQGHGYDGLLVPGEVEVALRGGLVISEWRPDPPAPTTVTPAGPAERDPEQIVAEAGLLLDEWGAHPAARLKTGGLGVRELKKAAGRTGLDERIVRFLYALLAEAGLLCQDARTVTAAPEAKGWALTGPAEKWATLFETWRKSILWNESEDGLLLGANPQYEDHSGVREAIMSALAGLPAGAATDLGSLAAASCWMRPRSFHCEDCAARFAERIVEGLALLGVATRGPAFALLEPARAALRDPGWVESAGEDLKFSSPVEHCTVQADLTVIVPGTPSSELGRGLARFAELKASSPARVYRISEGSLQRALDAGASAEEMISLLENHAPKGVPQSVTYLIEDVARRHGRVSIGEAGLFVRADEPALLSAIVADRKIAKLEPRVLAPTVAVFSDMTAQALLKALRAAGYMPVVEDGGLEVETQVRTYPIIRRGDAAGVGAPSEKEARALAEALLEGRTLDGSGPAEGTVTDRDEIDGLFRRAVRDHIEVEVGYFDDDGFTIERVEPGTVRQDRVFCWTLDEAPAWRILLLDRIGWARMIGEGELREDR